ncbi:hypothetical protein CUMW_220760 [Citrus unshiu]|uniref:Uncharacterized protein n=1 Tax=Citrus unshiu TaxID=55188 RepID=A0A2H5QE00_CITUN|nr:hypothetical protein CUMW_220760 [Citrus unshiu]
MPAGAGAFVVFTLTTLTKEIPFILGIALGSHSSSGWSLDPLLIHIDSAPESRSLDTDVSESINSSICRGSLSPVMEDSESEDSISNGATLDIRHEDKTRHDTATGINTLRRVIFRFLDPLDGQDGCPLVEEESRLEDYRTDLGQGTGELVMGGAEAYQILTITKG